MNASLKQAARRLGLRRARLATLRLRCERACLAAIGSHRPRPRGRILCYHSVGTPQWGVNDVSPARFRRQLELALALGYRFVPAETIARTGGQPHELAVTFDDGLTSVATNAVPILAEFGVPWMLFVVSNWADGNHGFGDGVLLGWHDIERLAAHGSTIGSHSVSHPNFGHLTPDEARYELAESRRVIWARTGITTTAFAIPMGQSADWSPQAATAAQAAGYDLVYAQSEDRRAPGTVARTFITRFDNDVVFRAALRGAFDRWEEWT